MSDRFPSISQDGLQVAASALPRGGRAVQYVGSTAGQWQPHEIEKDASGGVWQVPGRLLFVRNKDGDSQNGAILVWDGARVDELHAPGLEGWSCHNGIFAGWRRGDRLKSITVSRDGHVAGTVDIGDGRRVSLQVDGVEIDLGAIGEPRYTGETLVWIRYVDGVRRVFGRRHHGAPTEHLSVLPDDEFWPLAIETARGLFVMTHGHPERGRPLFMRPWGKDQHRGHIVAHGITDRPDARELPNGLVLIAFSTLVALQRVFVNLNAAPVDIREPIVVPPPPPDPDPVDPPSGGPMLALEVKHSRLIEEYAARFGMPGLSHSAGQEWIKGLAETFAARWPNEGWGRKSAGGGRPISNESLARKVGGDADRDGRSDIVSYDLIRNAGAANQELLPHAHPEDIDDQDFHPVTPKDHLAGSGTPDPGTPPRDFPSFSVPWDIFVDATIRFRGEIHDRDKLGGDSMGAGALGYFVPHFYASIIDDIKRGGLPIGAPEQVYALWAAMADRGVARGLALYHRDQGRP